MVKNPLKVASESSFSTKVIEYLSELLVDFLPYQRKVKRVNWLLFWKSKVNFADMLF
jgi:hypothetical protein